MNSYISLVLVIFSCAIVLFFHFKNNNIENFSQKNYNLISSGYCGPNWNNIKKHQFIKKKCIPNMNPDDCENFNKYGVKCGANFDNWEQYDCKFNSGKLSKKCNNNYN